MTFPPRHRTLRAAIAWSFDLLDKASAGLRVQLERLGLEPMLGVELLLRHHQGRVALERHYHVTRGAWEAL